MDWHQTPRQSDDPGEESCRVESERSGEMVNDAVAGGGSLGSMTESGGLTTWRRRLVRPVQTRCLLDCLRLQAFMCPRVRRFFQLVDVSCVACKDLKAGLDCRFGSMKLCILCDASAWHQDPREESARADLAWGA